MIDLYSSKTYRPEYMELVRGPSKQELVVIENNQPGPIQRLWNYLIER